MTDATIAINPDGTGTVELDGTTTPLSASSVTAARQQATQLVAQRAAALGQPVSVTAIEGGREWPLVVTPDGSIAPRTATDAVQQPAPVPAQPTITEIPQPEDDLDATRPRPVAPSPDLGQPGEGKPAYMKTVLVRDIDPATLPDAAAEWTSDGAEGASLSPAPAPPAPGAQVDVPASPAPAAVAANTTDAVENDPRWTNLAQKPAEQGMRGTLNGMGLKLAPTDTELAQRRETLREDIAREERERLADEQLAQEEAAQETRRAARERATAEKERAERAIIQTSYDEPKTVTLANDKGGVGKTTDTLCLAAAAGRIRGGDVIAWDANETRGTMGFRALKDRHNRSVVDFLEEAAQDFTTVEGSKRTTLTRYTRGQGDNKFSVLASDESRRKQDQVDGDAFRTVHEIVGRFHSLVFVDTGNNHEVSHFKAALAATDQLVVPVSPGEDGAYAAELMLDLFIGWGYGDLVKNAVVLLHDSATQHGDARAIAAKFENRVRTILPIPFDRVLDAGGQIDFDALAPATRAAYQTAAAAISHGLAGTKES